MSVQIVNCTWRAQWAACVWRVVLVKRPGSALTLCHHDRLCHHVRFCHHVRLCHHDRRISMYSWLCHWSKYVGAFDFTWPTHAAPAAGHPFCAPSGGVDRWAIWQVQPHSQTSEHSLHWGTPVQTTHTACHANNGQGEGVEVHACYSTHKENSCLIGASCFVIQKNSCLVPLVSYLIKNLPDTEHSLRSNDKGRTFDHKKVFSFTNLLLWLKETLTVVVPGYKNIAGSAWNVLYNIV